MEIIINIYRIIILVLVVLGGIHTVLDLKKEKISKSAGANRLAIVFVGGFFCLALGEWILTKI